MIIYKATNLVNGKVYIGQTKQKDFIKYWVKHLRDAYKSNNPRKVFYRAIQKYGPENFMFETLEFCDSKEELDEMEFHYIKQYKSYIHEENSMGYNMTLGGEGFTGKFSMDHKRKLSEARFGKVSPNKNKVFTEDHKKKISIKLLGNTNSKGNVAWNKGKRNCYSDEYIKKQKESHTNPRKEIREKMSITRKGKVLCTNLETYKRKFFKNDEIPVGWKKGK